MVEKDGFIWLKDVWPMLTFSVMGLIWAIKKGRDQDHLEKRVDDLEVDLEKTKDCIKPALCDERMETCQKYIQSELGHGEKRFERLEETVKETRKELKEDIKSMRKDILEAIRVSN